MMNWIRDHSQKPRFIAGLFLGLCFAAGVFGIAYAATQTLTLGANTGPGGIITLFGSTSGSVTVQTAAAAGTSTLFQLPANNGTNTFVLQTDGTGVTSWTAAGTGNVTLAGGTSSSPQTFTGVDQFGEVHGTTETVTLTSNDYAAVVADCGKTKLLPTGTTPTVHLPNINPGALSCTITFITTATISYQFLAASGGSTINSQAFSHTRGTNAGDTVSVTLVTPSVSAAKWNISGDLTS